jgi:hypothetical protein
MKFTFRTPDSSHGIRVIDEIPDLRLCRVEGLNGIGKTLAIHLLEICTGQQPYATRPGAWRTLCEYLGPAEVVVEGLAAPDSESETDTGVHTLKFNFDWTGREDETAPREMTAAMFDAIELDGSPVDDMSDVRRWLRVARIAGDQSLTDTIANIVAYDLELVRAAAAVAQSRSEYGDKVLNQLLSDFSLEDAQRALAVSEEIGQLARQRAEFDGLRAEQASILERLDAANEAHSAVADVTSNAGALRKEVERLEDQLEEARKRTAEAEQGLENARESERLSAEVEKKLESIERKIGRRLPALRRAEAAIEELAASLEVVADPKSVEEELQKVERRRQETARERADLADLFALRDLLDGLVTTLAPAATGGLRGRTIATLEEQPVTAGKLLDAVRKRRERLLTDAPAVEELDALLAGLESREGRLQELEGLIGDRNEKRRSLKEAEEELEQLGHSDGPDPDSVAEKSAARTAAQRVEIEVGSALGAAQRQLAQLGGGISLEDLQAKLERRLNEADTSVEALEKDLRQAQARLVELDDQLDAAAARAEELESLQAHLDRSLAQGAQAVQNEDRHARLRELLGGHCPDPSGLGGDLAREWIAAHEAADRAVRRFQAARGSLNHMSGAMGDLVEAIRREEQPSPGLDQIRALYQERMLRNFSQPELLQALFDGGELTRVDLASREVVWQTAESEPRVRPFEAFSSGERAFAYVQAQLASIADQGAANKAVAVDEFGAFLSRDRLIRLQEVIRGQLDSGVIDQAIVVLPLSRPQDLDSVGDVGYVTGAFDALGSV